MDPEKIGRFICELRKEKGLSQYQLAELIPISRQGVSKWERGVTTPDTQTLIQLSEMFDVTINELLKGERLQNNTIEQLEETTLDILDQSNKKTKKIKRITITSITIITILLLLFLSYYFINSYNSMEVYKIASVGEHFTTTDGIFITTREKYYLRLGKIKNKENANITNIKLYYKKNNKNIKLIEDKEIDNITIMDSYGYKEKLTKKDINELKDNLYLEIEYNETEKEIIKLRYTRDYNNSSLFFMKQQKDLKTKVDKKEPSEEKKAEEVKEEKKEEETKPTIQETKKEETKSKEEPKQDPKPETPKEPEITIDQVISKIKENCIEDFGTYMCEYQNNLILYYQDTSIIEILRDDETLGEYNIKEDRYVCTVNNCKNEFNQIFKEALFS